MAVVTSFTAQRITELLGIIPGLVSTIENLEVLVAELRLTVESAAATVIEFNEEILPPLTESLAQNDVLLGDLKDNVLPNLELTLEDNQQTLANLTFDVIPAMQLDLDSNYQNLRDAPKVYIAATAPTNPDEDERYLVVGDVWHDSDDNNKQRIWNGAEWSTFGVDIPDLSITVRKFMTGTHMLY